ncbi:MAG TPA: PqqD family protein [Gemmatimonadales bacterium]
MDGQFSLYDASGRQAEPLSLRAALIWTYCDGQHHVDAIVKALVGNLPDAGDPDTARREVSLALDQFAAQGLLS